MSKYDPDKEPQSLAELEPMILAAQAELSKLCNGHRFRMSIPVQDDDTDMLIGDALRHSLAFVKAALSASQPPHAPAGLRKLAEMTLCVRLSNTPEFMELLAETLTASARELGEDIRVTFDGHDGFKQHAIESQPAPPAPEAAPPDEQRLRLEGRIAQIEAELDGGAPTLEELKAELAALASPRHDRTPADYGFSVEMAARHVLAAFEASEAAGYQSRDRQFAITLLRKAFDVAALSSGADADGTTKAAAPSWWFCHTCEKRVPDLQAVGNHTEQGHTVYAYPLPPADATTTETTP